MEKRKRSLSDGDTYENNLFISNVYNLPDKLDITNTKQIKIYENIKTNLLEKEITLERIIKLENILDNERLNLIEKYTIMENSQTDLQLYFRQRDEILDLINFYSTSNLNQRKINIEKKNKLNNLLFKTSTIEDKILLINNEYVQSILYSKYKKLEHMSQTDNEYFKLKDLIETSISIPFEPTIHYINNISQHLLNIKIKLDKELYGMNKIKEELLMLINQRLINPTLNTSIALVGPPGIGKTKIITVLGEILGYPFEHISLGGLNDSSYLAGHSYTYEGAKPGKIVESLIKMKTNNGIIFFDEIDKITSKEVSNQLLHITDFTQNNHFIDRYITDIPIDLSKIWFIFSLNSISNIDPILSNRLNYIHLDDYTIEEKINICKIHLIPEAILKYKLNKKYIFSDKIINKIVSYNNTTGIREQKRTINKIFNKLALLENSTKDLIEQFSFNINLDKEQINITDDIINKLL
jgi:ATP-dependent Lon protease